MRAGNGLGRSSVLLSWVLLSSLAVTAPGPSSPPDATHATAAATPPQAFELNQGQADLRSLFISRADGLLFRLDPAGIDLDLGVAGAPDGSPHARLVFPGASPDARLAGLEPLAGTVSYFAGSDPDGWIRDVPTFAAVRYQGLYPDVNLTVRGDHRRLTLTFSLEKGADPDVIGLSFGDGSDVAAVRLHRSGGRHEVSYTIDRAPESLVRAAGAAGASGAAGADGARMTDEIARIVVDRDGTTWVAGRSLTAAAAGVAAGAEAFVARIDRDGRGPAWTAWFGGAGRDVPLGLAVAPDGSVVVAGRTESADFPCVRPVGARLAGTADAFASRIASDGRTLLASTYLGRGGEDEARAVALDANGNAWVAGTGSDAAMLTVLSPEGDRLVRSSAEIATAQAQSIDAIAIDAAGRLHAAGSSAQGLFLATLATDGAEPVASSPIPLTGPARATDLACDAAGTTYVVGRRVIAATDALEKGFAAVAPASPSARTMVTLLDRVPLTVVTSGDGHAFIAGEEVRGAAGESSGKPTAGQPTAFIARLSGLDAMVDRIKPIAGTAMVRATGLALDPDGRPIVAGLDRADADGAARLFTAAVGGGLVAARPVPEGSITAAAAGCPGTIRFDNSAGTGLWQTATNWNTDVLPGAADDVCIPAGMAAVLSTGTASIGSLFVESGGSLAQNVTTTLTIASASQVDGTLTLTAGTLTGNFDLVVNGTFNWNGGTMSGAGTTEANTGMAIGTTGTKDLTSSRVLNTHGTVTWTGTGTIRLGSGGAIHNLGTWDARSDATITNSLGGTTLFDNPTGSTFKKTLGSGVTTVDIPWSGDGAVSIETGTVSFTAGGSSNGSFTGLGSATLRFAGGAFTLGSASTVNVPNASVTTGSLTVNGAWTTTVSGSSGTGSTWTFNPAATLSAVGPSLTIGGTLVLNSGEAVDVTTLTVSGGSRQGTDTLSVSGTFAWSAGSLNGAATTNANGPLALSGANVKDVIGGHVLNTKGATTWTGTGTIRFGGGSIVHNTAAWEAQNDTQINNTLVGGGSFDNQVGGSFTKKTGTGTTALNCPITNAGSIVAETGTISFGAGGSGTGSYTGLTGTTLQFNGGTFTLDATATLNAPNVVVSTGTASILGSFTASSSTALTSGTLTFEPSATLASLGALSVSGGTLDLRSGETVNLPTLTVSGGATQGTDLINVAGPVAWSAGSIGGAATLNANGGMAVSSVFAKDLLDGRTLNTFGTVTWSGTGALRTRASSIRNAGTWQAQSDAQMSDSLGAGGTFDNLAGATFQKTAGTGNTSFSLPFLNHGTIEIQSGAIEASKGGSSATATAITGSAGTTFRCDGGLFSLDSGSTFQVPNLEVAFSGTLEVHGSFQAASSTTVGNSGTLTLLPEATVTSLGTTLAVTGGTLDARSGETLDLSTLTLNVGTIKGSDTLNVSGALTWSAGTITEIGIVNANGGGTLSGVQVKDLTGGRVLNTAGTIAWTGTGLIRLAGGAAIHNSGTWSAQGDAQISILSGTGLFDNMAAGTFQRAVGTGTLQVLADFTNAGSVRAQSGTLQFSTSYTQTAGSLSLEGGAVLASVPLAIQGGSLAGSGTVTGNVNMNGHLAPGLSPGSLTITGTLTDTAASSYDVEIGGLTPATEHDRALLSAAPTLAGTLNVTLVNGFVPADLNTFTILNFPSATGTFATVNTPVLPGGLVWQIFYTPTTVFLKVISDLDGDGVSNLVDCAPADPTAWAVPAEVTNIQLGVNNQTVSWGSLATQAGPATIYDLMRGLISQLPVGGKPAETCLAPDSGSTSFVDATTPSAGTGFYYLVRGSNICGVGTYGTTSGGAPRNTAVCP